MTQRLYYQDCYLREFRAGIVELTEGGRRAYLDRTAFYPIPVVNPSILGPSAA